MLDNTAERADVLELKECGTPPNWNALEQAVEELLDLFGTSHASENSEASDHLTHLEKFDWAKASLQGSTILRRR